MPSTAVEQHFGTLSLVRFGCAWVCVPQCHRPFVSSALPLSERKGQKMKQRYLKVNHELIPVTEEVYQVATRWKENERYRARRDGKCGQPNYRRCSGDCGTCPWQQEGYRVLSLTKVLGDSYDTEPHELDRTHPSFDDVIADKLLLEELYRKLDELIPGGAQVFQMRAHNYSEREIAKALGIKSQSTLNYRIKKMDAFIRAHRDELEDLLR